MIHLGALLFALVMGVVFAYPDVVVISQSKSSTAAISYLFLPSAVFPSVVGAVAFYYATFFAVRRFRAGKKKEAALYGVGACFLFLLGYFVHVHPYLQARKIADAILPIAQMDNTAVDRFIDQYQTFLRNEHRIFLLNALLEKEDLTAVQLDKIAKIDDPALHKKLYSRYGLRGNNRKGLSVARLVARHNNVSADTLAYLATIDNLCLQSTLAANEKTPMASLIILYQKLNNNLGQLIENASENSSTPVGRLQVLAIDCDCSDWEIINVYERLARNPNTSADILRVIHEKTKQIYQHSENSGEYFIASALANNPNTPVDILKDLATNCNCSDFPMKYLYTVLANNPNTPADVLELMRKKAS